MGDILKEAIADAKAVRETALANAKMALEEAFTPQLQSMLSAKLREDDDEFEGEEEVGGEEGGEEEEEIPAEEAYEEDEEVGGEEEFGDEEAEMEEEGVIEINGVKYAPVVVEDEEEGYGDEDEEEVEEEELDLEAIIRELESELSEDETSDEDTVDEADESDDETVDEADTSDDETVDEELEIDESLFTEDDDDDDDDEDDEEEVEESTEISAVQSELDQYKEAVHFLKDKLHEVNILNAKLLFTNKLFKEYSLDNGQKLKVVETFDRAQTTREIKLVYSTLAEQFGDNGSITKRNSVNESASSAVSSTKPSTESKKVITEEAQVANRFKKLAGIIK